MTNLAFTQLLVRVLCDTKPAGMADGAFLFGQTEDNQESVFVAAQQLLSAMLVKRILFVETGPISGYPGFKAWQVALHNQGIGNMQIEGVTGVQSEILHTLIEAETMVRFAKEKRYKCLYIVSPPFHQPRAFMTAVTAALREYPDLQLYSFPGMAQPWDAEVTHSQGKTHGSRLGLLEGELARIQQYNQQGDLAPVEEVLDYMKRRDKKG